MARILVVDDEPEVRDLLAEALEAEGHEVRSASGVVEAEQILDQEPVDVLLTDLKMPDGDGIQLIAYLRELDPQAVGVVITGFGTIETAVQAMRAGAYDYLTKPVQLEELSLVVERALEYRRLQQENVSLRRQLRARRMGQLVGKSPAMREVFELIDRVAESDSTVLVLGESGTGKELVARAIHQRSRRRHGPFVPVNCGAIPDELLESELFGHVRGAFTGAVTSRPGRFEMAQGGTIFLDEVGDMSPKLQVKLLRVLQEREFERVGGTKPIRADVRVIAATHRDLEEEVRQGRFRDDLFYRLNVIPIRLPPLRERPEDIPLLLDHFLRELNRERGSRLEGFSSRALDALMSYPWPGNVRELRNLVERLAVLKRRGTVELEDLPDKIRHPSPGPRPQQRPPGAVPAPLLPEGGIDLRSAVSEFERRLILEALERAGGVKEHAARLLGLKRTTLVEKLRRLRSGR